MNALCFHLSIPAINLDATEQWYVEGLGCQAGRRSDHALILELGGHQLVAQLIAGPPDSIQPGIYPRHFGLVMQNFADWESLRDRAQIQGMRFGVEPKCRFKGRPLEHHTFFLIDPSNNWLEFKYYSNSEAILGFKDQSIVGDLDLRG